MAGTDPVFVIVYVIGAAALVGSAWTIDRRWRARTSIRAASVMMVSTSIWLSSQIAELLSTTVSAKMLAVQIQFCCMVVVATAWLIWILLYTRRRRWVSSRLVSSLLTIDILIVAVVLTNAQHQLIWDNFFIHATNGRIFRVAHGWGYWLVWGYLYALFAAGIILLTKTYFSASKIYRWEVTLLLLASVVPWFFGLVDTLEWLPAHGARWDVTAAAVSSTLAAWLLYRLRSRHLIPVARKAILENLSDAVVVIDPRGRIIDANPSARTVFGIAVSRPVNHALKHYWLGMPSLSELKQWSVTPAHEVSIETAGQTRIYDLRTSTIRDAAERTVCHVVVLRDITDRKQVELERDRFQAELQYARRLESLAMFAGGMAHEFNNAFTRMIGHTSLALEAVPAGAPVVEHLHAVERQISRAAELAKQILAYSGKGRFLVEHVNLGQVVRESEAQIRALLGNGTLLQCEIPKSMPSVEADPMQLRLMLTHLVANAVEALNGERNVVQITTGAAWGNQQDLRNAAYCHAEATPGPYVFLQICDTGCGMDASVLARVFDPFFSTKFTGRGLGMAAVLGIIRAHKGWIRITSEPGAGTTVHVAIPVAREAQSAPAPRIQNLRAVS